MKLGTPPFALFLLASSIVCVVLAAVDFSEFIRAYLVSYMFWFGLSAGSLTLLLIYGLSGGRWGERLVPYFLAGAYLFTLLPALFLPILLGIRRLYPWARGEETEAFLMAGYLNQPFFLLRSAFYFAMLILLVILVRTRISPGRGAGLKAGGLIAVFLTLTFSAIDWGMSLSPEWSSTAYGLVFGSGYAACAMAFTALAGAMRPDIPGDHRWEQAKVLLTAVIIALYLGYAQYLVAWTGNIAEEVGYYVVRTRSAWRYLALAILLLKYAFPLVALLIAGASRTVLLITAAVVLVAHFAELVWWITPAFGPFSAWQFVCLPASAALIGGVWLFAFRVSLNKFSLGTAYGASGV